MSLISTLADKAWEEIKKKVEEEVVKIMKELIRPYLMVVQVQQMNIKAIGVPAANENITEGTKAEIEAGTYQPGSKTTNPIEEEEDELIVVSEAINKGIIPKEPIYGIEETYYIISNRVTMEYALQVVEDQINAPGKMTLDEVETYEDLGVFLKGLCEAVKEDVNQAIDDTGEFFSKLPAEGLEELIRIGDAFVDCFEGCKGAAINIGEAGVILFEFGKVTINTIIDAVAEGTALAANPMTSSAAPGYIKKEITQLMTAITALQERGDKVVLDFTENLDKITAPLGPLKMIVDTLGSPTGGIVLALVFRDNSGKVTELLSTVGRFTSLISGVQSTLCTTVSASLSAVGCSVKCTTVSGEVLNITGNADMSTFTTESDKGLEQSKKAMENYYRDYWGPAQELMTNYLDAKTLAETNGEYTHVAYTTSVFGKGIDIKSMSQYNSVELLKTYDPNTMTKEVDERAKFIKGVESAIKGLNVYYEDYKETYTKMEADYNDLKANVESFRNGGSSSDLGLEKE